VSIAKTPERVAMLRHVADDAIEWNATRGAWDSTHKKPMGGYQWVGGRDMTVRQITTLVELRHDEKIVTVPVNGSDLWRVCPTPAGTVTLNGWVTR
jgi:hypothetical protein